MRLVRRPADGLDALTQCVRSHRALFAPFEPNPHRSNRSHLTPGPRTPEPRSYSPVVQFSTPSIQARCGAMPTRILIDPTNERSSAAASAKELADGFTAATGAQWTQPIGFVHALFEVAVDSLERATSVDDKAAIRDAIKATDLDTIVGHIAWDGAGLPPFAATNVAKTPLVGGQWVKGTGDFDYDLVIVSNKDHPDIPAAGTMQPIPGS